MNVTSSPCNCCREGFAIGLHDADLGPICVDCAEGITISAPHMDRNGIIGVYHGPCGDNAEVKP